MRTLSLPAKLVTYCAAALGLVYSLSLPWYGAAGGGAPRVSGEGVPELDGSFFQAASRWVTDSAGTTGSAALHGWATALVVIAAAGFLGAALAAVPASENLGRSVLRLAALAAIGIVLYKLIAQPAANDEARRGSLVALACGLVMLSAGSGALNAKRRQARPAVMTTLHQPGLVEARHTSSSVAPPGPPRT